VVRLAAVAMSDGGGTRRGSLRVDDVSVAFGGLTALSDVSLHADIGEVVGVIGPNGAGKTTLFNVVCGFVTPRSGSIVLDGRPVRRVRTHRLADAGVARTLQGVGLWPGLTVLENVMAGARTRRRSGLASALLGVPRSSRSESALAGHAVRVLGGLGVAGYAERLPGSLPYAVQKRVALARALAASPRMLLLDEPASGLSDAELVALHDLVLQLRERMGVVLVEHHMDFVMSVCDRVVVLDFGRVIATGTPEEVQRNPAVAAAYLGRALVGAPANGAGGSEGDVHG
jgi:branched-chain amino acid transport system ATP-binding protein